MHFFLNACPLLRAEKLPPEPINRSNGSFSVIIPACGQWHAELLPQYPLQ